MKLQYFNNLETSKNSKSFKINTNEIIEKETLFVNNNDEIAKPFNKYFAESVEKLNTFECPSNNENLTEETLTKIIKKIQEPSKNPQNLK